MSRQHYIEQAQHTITQALVELELATEGYVRGIEIVSIDATSPSDRRPQMKRRVLIDLQTKPDSNWTT